MAGIVFSKSSGLNDSIFGRSAQPIMMFMERKAEAFEQQSLIPKLFLRRKSSNFAEKVASMTSMDSFKPVPEGGAYPKTDMQEGFSKVIEFVTFKNQFMVTKEMIEDNKLLDMSKPLGFTQSYYRAREQVASALYVAAVQGKELAYGGKTFKGMSSSADGKFAFATDHPAKVKGAAQSNKFSNAFSVDMLSALETRMQNIVDDNGNILNIAPDTIVIPNDGKLKRDVFAAIGADKDPATANNGFNYQFGRWNVIVSPYLNALLSGSDKPWLLMDSTYNDAYGGALFIDRVPLEVHSWVDENTDNNVWNGRARFMCGFNDWRFAAVAGVTGGTALAI